MAQILVVSDGSLLAGLIHGSLRDEGHEITHAANPTHALDIASGQSGGFDLILTDVQTKTMSGVDFAKRLTAMGIQTPVLFMSESRSVASVLAYSLGRSAVIGKPFTARQLRSSVRKRLVACNSSGIARK